MGILEKMRQEEAEMEKQIFGGEETPSGEEPEAPSPGESEENVDLTDLEEDNGEVDFSTTFDVDDPSGQETDQDTDEEYESNTQGDPEPKPKQQRVSWKKRYSNYKAKTDSTIYNLRQELAETKNELADAYDSLDNLKKEMSQIRRDFESKRDPFEGIVSEEDKELLGEEAIEVIKKLATKKEADPRIELLEKELAEYKRERNKLLRKERDAFTAQSQSEFKTRLNKVVPSLETIDYDPKFHEFLKGIDEDSGVPRSQLFANAVKARDVKSTARFYLDFNSNKPKSKEEYLSSKVKPTGGGSSAPSGTGKKQRMIPFSEYSKYMDDVGMGKYKGDKDTKAKLDAMYDKAIAEGRIIY